MLCFELMKEWTVAGPFGRCLLILLYETTNRFDEHYLDSLGTSSAGCGNCSEVVPQLQWLPTWGKHVADRDIEKKDGGSTSTRQEEANQKSRGFEFWS